MQKDKIQEAYEKMLTEKTKFKYMSKANDVMTDFLEEIEDTIPNIKTMLKDMDKINDIWEELWDRILVLTRKV